MPQFRPETATADELYARWQDHIERIKTETIHLFTGRYQWREVVKMFEYNEALNKVGGNIYEWMLGMWGRDALMAIRRELDGEYGPINLVNMFREMEKRTDVLTRRRYLAHIQPGDSEHLNETMNRDFDRFGGVSGGTGDSNDDYIPADVVRADREALQAKADTAFQYAQRMVAHRTPVDKLEIQIKDIHDAIDAIFPALRKYYVILKAASLQTAEAAIQYHWREPFEVAWATNEYYEKSAEVRKTVKPSDSKEAE